MAQATVGTEVRPLRVAIVGAGPSGFFTAAALLRAPGLAVTVDILDRLPAPYGLVRYGVAPDHPKIKAVERVFEKLALDPRVRFLGNVELGRDVSRDDLLACYDQVVYAVGGQSDRRLEVPGEDLAGCHSSTAFVAWYSGHPDFVDLDVDLSVSAAAVIGIGNVAMDVARVLARSADDLATTDIADGALATLRGSNVRDVYIIARRGPVEAKCTPPELKELGELGDVAVRVEPEDLDIDPASAAAAEGDRQTARNLELLSEYAAAPDAGTGRAIRFKFLRSPVEILGDEDGRVTSIRLEHNRLEDAGGGYQRAVGTGRFETLPVGLVVRAVGYRSLPLPGVPFDERRGVVPNQGGRVVDPATGPRPREYVVGWVKRGPSGLIGSNKPDGVETAAAMIADLPALTPAAPADGRAACDRLLAERGVRVVSFADWQRLDRLEIERGKPHGRPRVKLVRVAEMLAALDDGG